MDASEWAASACKIVHRHDGFILHFADFEDLQDKSFDFDDLDLSGPTSGDPFRRIWPLADRRLSGRMDAFPAIRSAKPGTTAFDPFPSFAPSSFLLLSIASTRRNLNGTKSSASH
jgi:hypothetical protein